MHILLTHTMHNPVPTVRSLWAVRLHNPVPTVRSLWDCGGLRPYPKEGSGSSGGGGGGEEVAAGAVKVGVRTSRFSVQYT